MRAPWRIVAVAATTRRLTTFAATFFDSVSRAVARPDTQR